MAMEISTIIEAFTNGGWGLVLAIVLCYSGKVLYKKLSEKFEELNKKVDELSAKVTELKVESSKFETAILMCDSPSCRAKRLLEENK